MWCGGRGGKVKAMSNDRCKVKRSLGFLNSPFAMTGDKWEGER